MNDDVPSPEAAALPAASASLPPRTIARAGWAVAVLGLALALAALLVAWNTQQRVRVLERELVQRQQDSQGHAAAARELARAAEDVAREAAAKVALLEARVAENSVQRTQLEDLIQTLSRSRDENVLADLEVALRVAQQHSAITGSAEPLVATLMQAQERLTRLNHPGLERVQRAVARDLERVKSVAVPDIATLAIRLDEAMRQIDELPLLASAQARRAAPPAQHSARAKPAPAPSVAQAASAADGWRESVLQAWQGLSSRAWEEMRSLVRVTRIDTPEAVLVAPEQAFFLRENVKLRLLNARLALLSRQFDTALSDLRDVQAALDRYFDRGSRRFATTAELVRQVAVQVRHVSVPRPDDTLAALAAAGR